MPYMYQCPIDGCEFSAQDSDLERVVETAQEHRRTEHGDEPDRDEIERAITGSGTP